MSTTLLEIPGYRVHGQLGKGGMAEVFLATQESLSRKVAIKVLRSAEDETFSQRFLLKQFRRYVPAVQCSMTP